MTKNPRARSRSRFGYPDMNPATLLFLTQELRRARSKHPRRDKNMELIRHYMQQLDLALMDHREGSGNAARVFTTGLQIAVMAIRLVEEGTAGNPYRGNAPDIGGPPDEYVQEQLEKISTERKFTDKDATDLFDKFTVRFTRK